MRRDYAQNDFHATQNAVLDFIGGLSGISGVAKLQTRPCSHCKGSGLELDPKAVGEQMKKLRKAANRQLKEMAGKLDISAQYLSDLERGNRPFSQELVDRYIALL